MGREGQAAGPRGREQCRQQLLPETAGQVGSARSKCTAEGSLIGHHTSFPRPQVEGVNKNILEAIDSFSSECRSRRLCPETHREVALPHRGARQQKRE